MTRNTMETWGFLGALGGVSIAAWFIVRFVAQGPVPIGTIEHEVALMGPPASAPVTHRVAVVAPTVVQQPVTMPVAAAEGETPHVSFVDSVRARRGPRSYDRSQVRSNP